MKTFFLFLLLSVSFAGQSQTIIGESREEALLMLPELNNFFKVDLQYDSVSSSKTKTIYKDSKSNYSLAVRTKADVKWEGTEKVEGEPKVESLQIFAPMNVIEKLFQHFKEVYATKTGYKTGGQYIQFEKVNIYYTSAEKDSKEFPMGMVVFERKM